MTCEGQFEQLSALLDGELDAREVSRIEAHLDECAVCRELEGRLRGLSQDLENQDFPLPAGGHGQAFVGEILSRAHRSPVRRLVNWVESPLQSPWLRTGSQFLFALVSTLLLSLGFIALWQLPVYLGPDAVSLEAYRFASRLEFILDFLQSRPALPSVALVTLPALLLMMGAWCFGAVSFLRDWQSGSPLESRRIYSLAFSLAALGPLASLPALLFLRWDAAATILAVWVATFSLLGFFLGWAKGNRPLPRGVLEFSVLVLVLGTVEYLARWAREVDHFAAERWLSETTIQVGPRWWLGLLMLLALSVSLFHAGLCAWLPVYRGRRGGRGVAVTLLALGLLGLGWCGAQLSGLSPGAQEAVTFKSQHVFVLAPAPDNRWIAAQRSYAGLVTREGDPLRHRLMGAFLDWDEPAVLSLLGELGSSARGRLPELAGLLSLLGEQTGSHLKVSTMKRAEALKSFRNQVHWRGEPETELSLPSGSVVGRVIWPGNQLEGIPMRLIPVSEVEKGVLEALEILRAEAEAGSNESLGALTLDAKNRFTRLAADGSFRFQEVEEGAYVVAFLAPQPVGLSVDSSLPGAFRVKGKAVELGAVTLHQPEREVGLELGGDKWRKRGGANLETGSSGPYVRLDDGAVLERFLDLTPYRKRSLRLKTLIGHGSLVWQLKAFSKSGELLSERRADLEETQSELATLEIPIPAEAGYLQILYRSRATPSFLYEARLEVIDDR